jgi:hypothetical protein
MNMPNLSRHLGRRRLLFAIAALSLVIVPARGSSAQIPMQSQRSPISTGTPTFQPMTTCQPIWLPTFGVGGPEGTIYPVLALTVFSDLNGPALYAGGDILFFGGVAVNHIARWNGSSWSALGGGLDNRVNTLKVFDDSNGPALYVGGDFAHAGGIPANHIAKWDGASWSALGSGLHGNATVLALAVFDDGSGPALYAAGYFQSAGIVTANNIAKWQYGSWSALGTGVNSQVSALTVFDDGSGPALY